MRGDEAGRGVRSTVYAYGIGDVAKIPNPDVPVGWLAEELRLTDLAAAAGAPTPCRRRIVDIDGRPALVQAHIEGPTMAQVLADDPEQAGTLGDQLAGIQHALAQLHPSFALPRQRDRVASKVHTAAQQHGRDLARALDVLPPDDQPLVLCHGDLHPGNVIRSAAGDVLVDWFDASRGTIAGEIARTMVMLRATAKGQPRQLGVAFESLAESYLASACQRSGLTPPDLADWQLVQLIARLAEGLGQEDVPALRRQLAARLAEPEPSLVR